MILRLGVVFAAGLLLAGCQSDSSQVAVQGGASAIDGQWMAKGGGVMSSFQGGSFEIRYASSGEVMASGNYAMVTGRRVRLEWVSPATQKTLSANCDLSGAATLTCKQAGGQTLEFQRAA